MNSFFLQSNAMLDEQIFKQKRTPKNKRLNKKRTQKTNEYRIAIMPFAAHNAFFEAGKYKLSGFEGGFLGAIGKQLNSASIASVHFGASYANLGDEKDEDFKINTITMMIGADFRRNLKRNFFIKARGDVFYFMNEAHSFRLFDKIKPQNLGFGVSLYGGKDFEFRTLGKVALNLGVDYKGLKTTTITTQTSSKLGAFERYEGALYNLIYVDLGAGYEKDLKMRFGALSFNAGAGVRGNVLGDTLAKSQVIINGIKSIDMSIDNDRVLGYLNLGASYNFLLKKIPSKIGLVYSGNAGDKTMSNAALLEFKMRW